MSESEAENRSEANDEDGEQNISTRRKSIAWNYFTIKDKEKRSAECNLCHLLISYRSCVSNLTRHLKNQHGLKNNARDTDDESLPASDNETVKKGKKHPPRTTDGRSIAWKYFIKKDEVNRVAVCQICQRTCSYRSSVTNLMRHIYRKHADVAKQDESDYFLLNLLNDNEPTDNETDTDEMVTIRKSSRPDNPVWKYFKSINNNLKIAKCLMCKRQFFYDVTKDSLKRHIAKDHPHVDLENNAMIVTDGGGLFELDSEYKSEMNEGDDQVGSVDDVVYIEEFVEDKDEERHIEMLKRKLSEKNDLSSEKIERHRVKKKSRVLKEDDTDDDTELVKIKKVSSSTLDSIDYFGQYLVSLLKKLPTELSNQLQLEMVKQVMTAQLTYKKKLEVLTPPSSESSISVNGAKDAINEEPIVADVNESNDDLEKDRSSESDVKLVGRKVVVVKLNDITI